MQHIVSNLSVIAYGNVGRGSIKLFCLGVGGNDLLTTMDEVCQRQWSGIEFALDSVVSIEHQRLCARPPSVGAFVPEAPKADVCDTCIQSFAYDDTMDFGLGCLVKRVNVQFCDAHFQAKGIARCHHVIWVGNYERMVLIRDH